MTHISTYLLYTSICRSDRCFLNLFMVYMLQIERLSCSCNTVWSYSGYTCTCVLPSLWSPKRSVNYDSVVCTIVHFSYILSVIWVNSFHNENFGCCFALVYVEYSSCVNNHAVLFILSLYCFTCCSAASVLHKLCHAYVRKLRIKFPKIILPFRQMARGSISVGEDHRTYSTHCQGRDKTRDRFEGWVEFVCRRFSPFLSSSLVKRGFFCCLFIPKYIPSCWEEETNMRKDLFWACGNLVERDLTTCLF